MNDNKKKIHLIKETLKSAWKKAYPEIKKGAENTKKFIVPLALKVTARITKKQKIYISSGLIILSIFSISRCSKKEDGIETYNSEKSSQVNRSNNKDSSKSSKKASPKVDKSNNKVSSKSNEAICSRGYLPFGKEYCYKGSYK